MMPFVWSERISLVCLVRLTTLFLTTLFLSKPSAERLCGAAARGAPKHRVVAAGQGEFPQKQAPAQSWDGPAVVHWWLGELCVLVLWTVWDRETVIAKNIRAFELRSL